MAEQQLEQKMCIRDRVCIETRPELVTKESRKDILDCLGNKKLQIAFVVESSNEYIRNQIHKKGLDENTYIKAMNILSLIHILLYEFCILHDLPAFIFKL